MELKNYKKDNDKQHEIIGILPGSIAEELEIKAGDRLVSINGKVVLDALDYHLYIQEEEIDLVIYMKDHDEAWLFEIEKDEQEDLGLIFHNNLMDDYTSCTNQCIFCFIDQLPKGMRETLYFKDDDARLSFLQGNYLTLTNMSEREISRVIDYHLAPINISIHTMNIPLREKMLKNRFAGRIIDYMDRLSEAGITMNGQIVLCKGINDGEELDYTLSALEKYVPVLQSLSIVPVGLSKHREGLYPLEPFSGTDCEAVLETVEKWQKHFMEKFGLHFVHAGDEFYIMADRSVPAADTYDGYLQLENGVGMTRVLIDSFTERIDALAQTTIDPVKVTIATGKIIEPTLQRLMSALTHKINGLEVQVVGINNDFFGERITVSGLLVGKDIISQLRDIDLGSAVFIPDNVLRSGEAVLLDDVLAEELKEQLDAEVCLVDHLGEGFIDQLLDMIKL